MKKAFLVFVFLILNGLLPIFNTTPLAQARGIDPWPWSTRLPFPWESIQGTWTERNAQFMFSFKVVENSAGDRHIKIKQLNAFTGDVVAQGLGLENSEMVVVASMTDGQESQFRLTVRSMQYVNTRGNQEFTGVTIESFDDELLFYFEIRKIKDLALTPTHDQSYKNLRCENLLK